MASSSSVDRPCLIATSRIRAACSAVDVLSKGGVGVIVSFAWMCEERRATGGARSGASEKCWESLVSRSRSSLRRLAWSQGGGTMSARCWRFRRRASQTGMEVRWGGRRGGVEPCCSANC